MRLHSLKVDETVKAELHTSYPDRFSTDPNVLELYSKDVARLPNETFLMLDSHPEGVVMPKTHAEVVALVDLSVRHKIPLTPRGAGSSGVLGSVPLAGGLTLYFGLMRGISELDEKNMTVRVEPGVVWKDLQEFLLAKGYDVRIQPTSTPSSTVAGWVAQGGIGLGSYQYGTISEQIVSLTVVAPNYNPTDTDPAKRYTKVLSGRGLNYINDAMGTTGLITSIVMRIRKADPHCPIIACYDSIDKLTASIDLINEWQRTGKIVVWTGYFSSPDWNQLKQRASDHRIIPERMWSLTMSVPKSNYDVHGVAFKKMLRTSGAVVLGDLLAAEEWETRFRPMWIAKLAPTLVPGEVYLPMKALNSFLRLVHSKMPTEYHPYEGTFCNPYETTCLFYSLDDERRGDFALGWGLSISFLDLAKSIGGRTYQAGAFLPHEAKHQLGKDRLNDLRQFKSEIDPSNLLNPGKLYAGKGGAGEEGILRSLVKGRLAPSYLPNLRLNLAITAGKPLMKLMGPMLPPVPLATGDAETQAMTNLIAQSESGGGTLDTWELYSCVGCNYCTEVCPMTIYSGWEHRGPRGRIQAMKELVRRSEQEKVEGDRVQVDDSWMKDMYCTLCSKCEVVCQVDIPFTKKWDEIKEHLTAQGYAQPPGARGMYESVYNPAYRNPFLEPAHKRDEWYREDWDLPAKADVVYFKGCVASYFEYKTLKNVLKILDSAGLKFTTLGTDEMCCGAPLHMSGQTDRMGEIAESNTAAIVKREAKLVVTACPGCFRGIKKYSKHVGELPFQVKHMAQFIFELIQAGKLEFKKEWKKGKVIYHDPCELGRITELETGYGVYEEPRKALKAIKGLELIEFHENRLMANCCGGGGILKAVDEPLSQKISKAKIVEAVSKGAETVVSACPSCNTTFAIGCQLVKNDAKERGESVNIGVADICDVVAKAL